MKQKDMVCPICESNNFVSPSFCQNCGYDVKIKDITDPKKLKAYLGEIRLTKKWMAEVRLKKKMTYFLIKTHGRSTTNPDHGGWSIRKIAKNLLGESHVMTSKDIKLAEALDVYAELHQCPNKTQAKRLLANLQNEHLSRNNDTILNFEDELRSYLEKNWDKTPFSKDWVLQKDFFNRAKYDTREIGELDLLGKHVKKPKWLVIELKRDKSSDKTVGQILRYMGWVKKNKAANNEKVEGLIISASLDDHLRHALLCVPDIKLKIYFKKNNNWEFEKPKFPLFSPKQEEKMKKEIKEILNT